MSYVTRKDILSWGRVERHAQMTATPRFKEEIADLIDNRPGESVIPSGLRRSYGDSALNTHGGIIEMIGLDRFIFFDSNSGVVRAEAGISIDALLKQIVPAGFFIPVAPGTRFVTLGGAIANDVHGKNHHSSGTIGRHVLKMELQRSEGYTIEISPHENSELFSATIGGLGLTGVITWVELQLQPITSSCLDVDIIPYQTLSEFWDLSEVSKDNYEFTVAWIDCTAQNTTCGRGIFIRGNWRNEFDLTTHSDRKFLNVIMEAPKCLLNRPMIKLFNNIYYNTQKIKSDNRFQHYTNFFFPLDSILNWNRLYGNRGFWQYQCVIPKETMKEAIASLLHTISNSGFGSFLSVLKVFGNLTSPGLMSFPLEGATLALDFPNNGKKTLQLFTQLDAIVSEANGRLYAAKDGRITEPMWLKGYPALEQFLPFIDPAFCSDFWRRVKS